MKRIQGFFTALAMACIALPASAHDNNWSVGVAIGNPYPPAAGYYAPPPPVYYAPPPVAVYPYPRSTRYVAPNVMYPPAVPGFIQFNYGGYGAGYGGGYGYRGGYGGHHGHHDWDRGRGHGDHDHHR